MDELVVEDHWPSCSLEAVIWLHANYPTLTSCDLPRAFAPLDDDRKLHLILRLYDSSPETLPLLYTITTLGICKIALYSRKCVNEYVKTVEEKGRVGRYRRGGKGAPQYRFVVGVIENTDILKDCTFAELTTQLRCEHCKANLLGIWRKKGYKAD